MRAVPPTLVLVTAPGSKLLCGPDEPAGRPLDGGRNAMRARQASIAHDTGSSDATAETQVITRTCRCSML